MRHNYEQISKDIDAQGITVGQYCKNNLFLSNHLQRIEKF